MTTTEVRDAELRCRINAAIDHLQHGLRGDIDTRTGSVYAVQLLLASLAWLEAA